MNETADILKGELQQLRTEFQQLRTELQTNQRWNVGLIFGLYAANIATPLAILFKQ